MTPLYLTVVLGACVVARMSDQYFQGYKLCPPPPKRMAASSENLIVAWNVSQGLLEIFTRSHPLVVGASSYSIPCLPTPATTHTSASLFVSA